MTDNTIVGRSKNKTFLCCRHWILQLTVKWSNSVMDITQQRLTNGVFHVKSTNLQKVRNLIPQICLIFGTCQVIYIYDRDMQISRLSPRLWGNFLHFLIPIQLPDLLSSTMHIMEQTFTNSIHHGSRWRPWIYMVYFTLECIIISLTPLAHGPKHYADNRLKTLLTCRL